MPVGMSRLDLWALFSSKYFVHCCFIFKDFHGDLPVLRLTGCLALPLETFALAPTDGSSVAIIFSVLIICFRANSAILCRRCVFEVNLFCLLFLFFNIYDLRIPVFLEMFRHLVLEFMCSCFKHNPQLNKRVFFSVNVLHCRAAFPNISRECMRTLRRTDAERWVACRLSH